MRAKSITRACRRCGAPFHPWLNTRNSGEGTYCTTKCQRAWLAEHPRSAEDIFSEKHVRGDGCWLWQGPFDKGGYGKFTVRVDGQQRSVRAHRYAWERHHNRPIPEGMFICHRCDVRRCVNPSHLFLGTSQDNIADRNAKMRQAMGERNRHAKLTEAEVLAIRERMAKGERMKSLSDEFGVHRSMLLRIKKRMAWRHI